MSFLHPEFLYYMLPPLFILFGLLLTQTEVQATFFSKEVIDRLRVSANTLTLKARNALFMLIGILLIFALSGPVIKEGKIEIKAKSADIIIALDISDSMLARDVYPNRLKLVKQKALEFLRLAPNERIGIVAFAKNSYLVSPLSFDHGAVAFLLKNLNTDSITEKGTDLMSMLDVVDGSIKNESRRYILLLSDGGDAVDFSREIAYAKKHNITLFILGIGTKKGAPVKLENGEFIKQNGKIILTKLNEKIADLAIKTGGVYIEGVNSNSDIKAMLREIEAKAKKKKIKSEEIERYIPLFYYPVGLALMLLLIATSSMSRRKTVDVPSMFLLALIFFNAPDAKAGFFDFVELKEAKEAYERQDYAKAAKIYKKYAQKSDNSSAYFNAGNSFYKRSKYKEAAALYEKSFFSKPEYKAKKHANLGNAYAKQGDLENLEKAKKHYEESLKLVDDKEVKGNLKAVEKEIKKKKKEQQTQKNKQQNKKQQQKQKKQQSKNQQNQKNQQNKQDQQNKQSDKEKNQERKSQKQSEEEKKNQKKNALEQKKNEQEQKDKEQQNKSKENAKKANEENKKQDKKEKQDTSMMQIRDMKDKMSDAEEKKWLKVLKSPKKYPLYRLNKEKPIKEEQNEKPW